MLSSKMVIKVRFLLSTLVIEKKYSMKKLATDVMKYWGELGQQFQGGFH